MTLTLFLGGVIAFGLAVLLSRGSPQSLREQSLLRGAFASIWFVVAILMLFFVAREGESNAATASNGVSLVGQTRIAVLEAGISLDNDLAQARFGGSPRRDDIILEGYPSGTFVVRRQGNKGEIELRKLRRGDQHIALFINEQRVADKPVAFDDRVSDVAIALFDAAPSQELTFEAAKEDIDHRFTLTRPEGGWQVGFSEPEVFYVPKGNIRPASADTTNQRRDGDNVTPLNSLGSRFDPSFANTELVLPDEFGRKTLVRGRDQGESFSNSSVQIEQAGFLTVLRVDPLNISAGLRGFSWPAMYWIIALSFFLSYRLRMSDPLAAAVLGVAEILLLIRILMAIEGGMVEETTRSRQALPDGLLALPMGLLVIHAAVQPYWRKLAVAVVALLVSAGLIAFAIQRYGDGMLEGSNKEVILVCAALAAIVLILRLFADWVVTKSTLLSNWTADRVMPAVGNWLTRFGLQRVYPHNVLGHWARPLSITIAISGVMIAFKIFMLVVFDASERYVIALSVIYIPLTLLAFLPLLLHLLHSDERPSAGGLAFFGGIAIFVFATQIILTPVLSFVLRTIGWSSSSVGGDVGLAIVLSLALSVLAASIWLGHRQKVTWQGWVGIGAVWLGMIMALAQWLAGNSQLLSWATPLALIILGTGLIVAGRKDNRVASAVWLSGVTGFAALILVTSIPVLQPRLDSPPDSASDLETSFRPLIRLTSALAPERLGFLDSSRARQNRESIEDISEYGKTAGGYGFLNVPNIERGVANQQFSDFGIAVHFVFPFGRYALAGLVLLTSCFGVLAFARMRSAHAPQMFGIALAGVFVCACLYMALANLLMAPVTGRNFYLLAPQSHSDLLEGLMLIAGAAVFLSYRAKVGEGTA